MTNWRRYVYLLVNNFSRATYPLRHIDASSLFFSSTNHQIKAMNSGGMAMAMALEEPRLPRPYLSFTPSPDKYGNGTLEFFSLFGRGKNKSLIAGADQNGFTFLYDLDQRGRPQAGTSVPWDLSASQDWRWYSLQPPPYVLEPGYTPTSISAYTVVNDSHIWISTPGYGTYSFDTASRRDSWSKLGDWELPFRGRADYFPEYNLWLGFSKSQDSMLCSSDLMAASAQGGPELLNRDWEDLHMQEGWILNRSFLVHLGFGKFCVAKFFETLSHGAFRGRLCLQPN
ncbi:hypothetical protein BAE44_0001449 [Dichanthelium oligosanthes]|uniref:Uncharacterized protein n=1 Tax=Dichanthelium oligosanthes TaxID=888268 RepID=A0A1E5WJE1_9POAL|nr:hypothetical protein BAE44_0001449 [Dichanthelium oligosanthes]